MQKSPYPTQKIQRKQRRQNTKVSTTDPESGFMHRDNKPKGFFYLDHRTVDGKHGIIMDTHVTAGNVHDSQPYIGRLQRQMTRFNPNTDGRGCGCRLLYCPGLSPCKRNEYRACS
ncbi:hypothetical protein [Proteus mirabilis]|uniref:hypothetical protein n=2 Tax=Proteus mirabilis TaxID=584 RepID=UPI003872FB90